LESLTTADPRVSEAIVIWTGFGSSVSPVRDETLVETRFGDLATELMPLVRALDDEFYDSNARLVAVDTVDMARRAKADFRALHPEVEEKATDALAWCYTFDFR